MVGAMSKGKSRHVVIVGGGFAGIGAAAAIGRDADVTLIDPTRSFEFIPNIPELISQVKTPASLRFGRTEVAKRLRQTFLQDSATRVDPKAKLVETAGGRELRYDALILAPGGKTTSRGIPGEKAHAFTCHSVEDAVRIRDHLRVLAGMRRDSYMTIVGGGFTGVEVLGETLRAYRKEKQLHIRVIEGGARLMRGRPKKIDERLRAIARKHDVDVHLETRVKEVRADAIVLGTGEVLPSNLTVWAVGKQAHDFMLESRLQGPGAPWAAVQSTLQTLLHPEVFIAGDAAHLPKPADKQAEIALLLGEHAGRNAVRFLKHKDPKPYAGKIEYPLTLPFGDITTFVMYPSGDVDEGIALSLKQENLFQSTMAVLDEKTGKDSGDAWVKAIERAKLSIAKLPVPGRDLSLSKSVEIRTYR